MTFPRSARQVSVSDGVVRLDDAFQSEGPGLDVEEALMTWLPVKVEGRIARVISDKGTLEIRADQGVFATKSLEEACKANHKQGTLTRIALSYSEGSQVNIGFTMTHSPRS
jgi:hypothetical protein